MARMIDRMMAHGFLPPDSAGGETEEGWLNFLGLRDEILGKGPPEHVIIIDNVAEYLYAVTDQEEWDEPKDFPNCAPPFDHFWMEYCRPSRINSREFGVQSSAGMPGHFGFDIEVRKQKDVMERLRNDPKYFQTWLARVTDGQKDMAVHYARSIDSKIDQYGIPGVEDYLTGAERDYLERGQAIKQIAKDGPAMLERYLDGGWLVGIRGFGEVRPGVIAGPFATWQCFIHLDGCLDGRPILTKPAFGPTASLPDEEFVNFQQYLFPCLLALSFMHCKNVTQTAVEPPARLNKARVKEGKPALVRYHTLEIEPMKKILRHEGRSQEHGLAKALHICRGHFRDYRNGAGLFGRNKGVYWWSDHIRGSSEHGTVVKDYKVTTKEEA